MHFGHLRVVKDMAISVGGNAVPLFVLQFIVLPALGVNVPSDQYGLVITLASFFSFCPATFGTVLNNVRLIRDNEYAEGDKGKDFSVLVALLSAVSFAASALYAGSIASLGIAEYLALGLTGTLFFLNAYWVVAFRLKIDYRSIFLANVMLALGYLAGFGLLLVCGFWELIYLCGQACMAIYLIKTTGMLKTPLRRTGHFAQITKEAVQLSIASFLARVSSYCDRMILFPLLGGTAASVYYVSTLLAKVVSLLATSINNVVLSYLAKKTDVSNKRFLMTIAIGAIICCICYGIVMVVSPPVLSFLYPQFVDEALVCLPITSVTAFVTVLKGLVDPYVLRFRPILWQILFSGLSVIIYFFAAFLLLSEFGLIGFCWGALIAEVISLAATVIVFCVSGRTREE